MNSIEALFSLMTLVIIVAHITPVSTQADYSLYRLQLAEDVWNVFYIKGMKEETLEEITEKTALCIYIEGIKMSSCRGKSYVQTSSIQRIVLKEGELKRVTLSIGPTKG